MNKKRLKSNMGNAFLLDDEFSSDILLGKTIAEAKLFINNHKVMYISTKTINNNLDVTLCRITDVYEGNNNDTSDNLGTFKVKTNNLGNIKSIEE